MTDLASLMARPLKRKRPYAIEEERDIERRCREQDARASADEEFCEGANVGYDDGLTDGRYEVTDQLKVILRKHAADPAAAVEAIRKAFKIRKPK